MDKPCEVHFIAAKRILRSAMYKQQVPFVLSGFVYADWVGDVNNRRSTSGYCFNAGLVVVLWCSKK